MSTLASLSEIERFVEPPLTGTFCDLLWADPLLEEVLGYKLSDKDYADVRGGVTHIKSHPHTVTSYTTSHTTLTPYTLTLPCWTRLAFSDFRNLRLLLHVDCSVN